MIYTVRVTAGQEKITSEILRKKSKADKLNIYSILHVDNVKGYIFVEAADEHEVGKLINKVRHVKGMLPKPVSVEEIEKLLKAEKQPALMIERGDLVEMTSGPFKGERAKVIKIDEAKDEITVELIEVAVPIPVTVKSKMVKLFKKAGEEE